MDAQFRAMVEQQMEVQRQRIDKISSVHQQIMEKLAELAKGKHLEVNEKISSNVDRNSFKLLPKLEFPSFDGSNPRNWVKKCSRYFALCNIPDSQKVDVASIHLTGKAETWFAHYSAVRKNMDWCDFILDVCTCFEEELGVTRQPNSGSGTPSAMDAHQVLDESPKSNPDICSDSWVGEGQGKMPVGSQNTVCEQLNGLNPSNDLLEQSDLCVLEELDEDANSGICMEEELPTLAGYSKALGLKSVVPELKVPNLPAHQIPKTLGWKEAIGFCELVFDPGILGPGPSTLQPDIVVFNSILNAYVPSHQWKAVSWVLEQLKKGGLKTNSAAYGLAMEVMLHAKKYDLAHELFEKVSKEACSGNGDSPPASDRHAYWISKDHGRRGTDCFCLFVFDPGKLGPRLSIPQAKSLVRLYAWHVATFVALVGGGLLFVAFDPGGLEAEDGFVHPPSASTALVPASYNIGSVEGELKELCCNHGKGELTRLGALPQPAPEMNDQGENWLPPAQQQTKQRGGGRGRTGAHAAEQRGGGSDRIGADAVEVAVKFEHCQVYNSLNGCYGVPWAHYKGRQGKYCILVMDMRGPSLWDVWNSLGQSVSPNVVACIVVEAILEQLHSKGFVHGEIQDDTARVIVATEGQPDGIVNYLEDMVRTHVEKPNYIILAISPANQDIVTSDAIKLARAVDPSGDQHLFLQSVKKVASEANGYPHLISLEQGHRRLIEGALNYFKGPAEASVDAVHFVLTELELVAAAIVVFDPGSTINHTNDELSMRAIESIAAPTWRLGKKGTRSYRRCYLMLKSWRSCSSSAHVQVAAPFSQSVAKRGGVFFMGGGNLLARPF